MSDACLQPAFADFIQAGYPCLFLRTAQPQVAEKIVRDALIELGMEADFGIWKVTTGLLTGNVNDPYENFREETTARDLMDALNKVQTSEDPMCIIFHNIRKFVDNPSVTQKLIDAIFAARLRGSHIILVGPHLELPPELRTLITYYDIMLPSKDDIKKEYERITTAYADEIKMPKGKAEKEALLLDAATAAVGLDLMGAENAIALSLSTSEKIDLKVIQAQKEQEVRKSDILEFFPYAGETMDHVGGYHAYKQWCRKRQRAFTQDARDYGLPYPKGVLIVGPAGTGKSLTAKATAAYFKLPLLRLDMGKIYRSLVGESEAAIRMGLQVAEAVSPVVLWLDEIEKGLAGATGGNLDSGVSSRVVSTILTWRQETKAPVMLCATANDVADLPAMVYRRGRMDEVWATDLPTENEREEILRIHIAKIGRDPDNFNCALIARKAVDFTGAELEGCIIDGMFAAFDADMEVSEEHILNEVSNTIPQAVRNREELISIRKWVETRARLVSGADIKNKSGGATKVRSIGTGGRKNKSKK